jgi:uncharacterized protein YuzE
MRISYDSEADAFYLRLADRGVHVRTSEEVSPNTVLDFDAEGNLVGIEVWANVAESVDLSRLTIAGFRFEEVVFEE